MAAHVLGLDPRIEGGHANDGRARRELTQAFAIANAGCSREGRGPASDERRAYEAGPRALTVQLS
jgi:hypothetical protein